jgi:hypothetical protein
MVRWSAQRALLGRSGVNIPVLSWMYGLPKGLPIGLGKDTWAQLVGESKLRLQVGELPIATGGSDVFKRTVAAEIAAFKQRWDWIISPLVVAVALEVVVRPNPKTPAAVLHDLDNIVRDYLLPGIVPSFGTVSDHRWTIDFDDLRQRDPKLAAAWGPNPTPPPDSDRCSSRVKTRTPLRRPHFRLRRLRTCRRIRSWPLRAKSGHSGFETGGATRRNPANGKYCQAAHAAYPVD